MVRLSLRLGDSVRIRGVGSSARHPEKVDPRDDGWGGSGVVVCGTLTLLVAVSKANVLPVCG